MITSHYTQMSTLHTMSYEVVKRVAIKREEDGLSAYHAAKRDYQLTMDRVSSRLSLPPSQPSQIEMLYDDNDISTYCSCNTQRLGGMMNENGMEDGPDIMEIDKALYECALRRQKADEKKRVSSTQRAGQKVGVLLHRESLARRDIYDVEHDLYREIQKAFISHPFTFRVIFLRDERRARKEIEDLWMTESLPFLDMCSMEQLEFIEAMWRRSFGSERRLSPVLRSSPLDTFFSELDVRLYYPLEHRCFTIRRETEDEEEIAFRYLQLGERAQRDLIVRGVMQCNKETGLLDSVRHPIAVCDYDEVDLAFQTEFRYLESCEETQRMMIVDAFLSEKDKLCTKIISA